MMLMLTLADVTDLEYHGQILASGITPITDLHTQAPGVSDYQDVSWYTRYRYSTVSWYQTKSGDIL